MVLARENVAMVKPRFPCLKHVGQTQAAAAHGGWLLKPLVFFMLSLR